MKNAGRRKDLGFAERLREAKLFGKKIKALAPMVQKLWPKTKTVKLNAT